MKFLLLFPCFFLLFGFSLAKADSIITNRKKLTDVTITVENFDRISYYFNAVSSRIPQHIDRKKEKILQIEREKYPPEYEVAENHFEAKVYNRAIESYEREAKQQEWTAQHCLYKIGLSYQKMKNYPKAIQSYKKLLDSFAETYYKAEAHFNMGICYIEGKRPASAVSFLQKASALYEEINESEKALESLYYLGQAADENKEYPKAIQVYEQLLKKITDVSLKNSVQLSLGHCYWKVKKISQSKEVFSGLLKSLPPENKADMASLYLGLGNCYFHEQNTKEALFCYLRLIMLYESQDETTREAYDKAAYCFELLKNQNPEYADRARQLKVMKEQKFK
ncbi:MAG: tetratricopeptide repeat protein [Candidatus Brocadiae bacterium]|nr:tetratricopeptide repeat protein [Candidatus Brocadiia bacterium]